jgi:hypothetical protein
VNTLSEYTPDVDVLVAVPAGWYKVAKFEHGRLTPSNVFIYQLAALILYASTTNVNKFYRRNDCSATFF